MPHGGPPFSPCSRLPTATPTCLHGPTVAASRATSLTQRRRCAARWGGDRYAVPQAMRAISGCPWSSRWMGWLIRRSSTGMRGTSTWTGPGRMPQRRPESSAMQVCASLALFLKCCRSIRAMLSLRQGPFKSRPRATSRGKGPESSPKTIHADAQVESTGGLL